MTQAVQTSYPEPVEFDPNTGEPQSVPYQITPPWGEFGIGTAGGVPAVLPPVAAVSPDQFDQSFDDMHTPVRNRPESAIVHDYPDPQYGAPAPGATNETDNFQSGPNQAVLLDRTLEAGWGTDPVFRPAARFSHYESHNPYYSMGIHRRNGAYPALNAPTSPALTRDTSGPYQRAVHGIVYDDPATMTNTTGAQYGSANPETVPVYTDLGVPPE